MINLFKEGGQARAARDCATDAADRHRLGGWQSRLQSKTAGPAGTFTRAYDDNRRVAIDDAIDDAIDADPVAACVRELMAERSSWAGSAADLLRAGANRSRDDVTVGGPGWPKNPRALAGRLRRAQSGRGHRYFLQS